MHNELHELQSRTEGVVSVDEANNELCLQIMEINPICVYYDWNVPNHCRNM